MTSRWRPVRHLRAPRWAAWFSGVLFFCAVLDTLFLLRRLRLFFEVSHVRRSSDLAADGSFKLLLLAKLLVFALECRCLAFGVVLLRRGFQNDLEGGLFDGQQKLVVLGADRGRRLFVAAQDVNRRFLFGVA